MKILVTGALGHIGSRVIRDLPVFFPKSEIVMVDNMMTQRYCSLFNLPETGNYQFLETDITKADLPSLLKGVHVVINLAAITDAAGSFDKAQELEENNFNSTKRLAEACSEMGVRFIAFSSTSIYGTESDIVSEECNDSELNPQSPYASTKLKEEQLVQMLIKEGGLKATIFRFGTIFGVSPGMRFHTAVNKFCWQASMGLPITVWSTAYDQKRPYLDLTDACNAIIYVIKKDLFDGRVFNVVTVNTTVKQIVSYIGKLVPDLKVTFVDNQIMNNWSYEVLCDRFTDEGFSFHGDLFKSISQTIGLLKSNIK